MGTTPFDWSLYLQVARDLASQGKEANLRSSISRAYYYVFNIALQRAQRNQFAPTRGESTHIQLWRLYNQSPEPVCIRLGEIGLRLKLQRERADYASHYSRIADDVPAVLDDAERFGQILADLAPRHPNPSSVRL